jgi:hypothetical protein
MAEDFILSVLGIVGVSGIVGAFFTYFCQKKKEIGLKEKEYQLQRYKVVLLLIYAYIKPDEQSALRRFRPDIQNKGDLKRELQVEWVGAWLFADDSTEGLKTFIDQPDEANSDKTILSIREEMWSKKTDLSLDPFSIKSSQDS